MLAGLPVDLFPPETENKTIDENPCWRVNCGEGGCYLDGQDKPKCICIETFDEPDEFGYCNRKPRQRYDPTLRVADINLLVPSTTPSPNIVNQNDTYHIDPLDKNESSSQPLVSRSSSGQSIHIQVIQVTVPIVGAIILMLTITLVLLKRRRSHYRRTPNQSESPIAWLHRQDSAVLLEGLVTIVSKNPNYYSPDITACSLANLKTKIIPRDELKLLEEIGEGAFGKVYRGEVTWPEKADPVYVAVKVLKEGASREIREDFKREVEITSAFDHPNILTLIGVVAIEADSPYMVFEYMEHGDLADLLRRNDPSMGSDRYFELKQLDLIDIATQIANGMMYLSSQHFVHRDLATRNCLVGADLRVKISDFGMSRDIYTCDYYRIGGSRMLPVRWMSPESVKYGRFTTESDVWALGVVLWEIFSYGKQPYYGHTNEEVIRFIEDGILLQRPACCPSTIYHVMLGCWRSSPRDRFSFERIHRHLKDYGDKLVKCYQHIQEDDRLEYEDIVGL